jgi:hypothetical protein
VNWRNIAITRFDPGPKIEPILGERNCLLTTVTAGAAARSIMRLKHGLLFSIRVCGKCAGTQYKTSLNQPKTQMLNAMFSRV